MSNFFISAGEVSGDIYAARVVAEFKGNKRVHFFGMGGRAMAAAGVDISFDPMAMSDIGFALSRQSLRQHAKMAKKMVAAALQKEAVAALLVDYSGYHMYLGKLLTKAGIPVLHYIPPGVWFWGRWRAAYLARRGIAVATIFPSEHKIYQEKGAEAYFVGHPLAHDLQFLQGHPKDENLIALLPGSRRKEVAALLPEMLTAVRLLRHKYPNLKFSLAPAAGLEAEMVKKTMELGIDIVYNKGRELLAQATLAIVASGTATLEAALLATPAVIVYKIDKLTFFLAKFLAQVSFIGLPNLLLGEEVLPELLQEEANSRRIYQEAVRLLQPQRREEIIEKFAALKDILTDKNPAREVAALLQRLERVK